MEVLEATTITGTTTQSTAMHLLKEAVEVVAQVDVMADGEAMVKEVTVMQENMVAAAVAVQIVELAALAALV